MTSSNPLLQVRFWAQMPCALAEFAQVHQQDLTSDLFFQAVQHLYTLRRTELRKWAQPAELNEPDRQTCNDLHDLVLAAHWNPAEVVETLLFSSVFSESVEHEQ